MADYPLAMAEHWSAGSEPLLVRPIRASDAPALLGLFHRLSSEEVRLRFFALIRDLTPEQLAAFTNLDYARDMALVAIREASGEIAGVARLARAHDPTVAEFAVVVEHALQGRGLAAHLMRRLFAWAIRSGISEVVGHILAENAQMLELARFLGFSLGHSPEEPELIEAHVSLARSTMAAEEVGAEPLSSPDHSSAAGTP